MVATIKVMLRCTMYIQRAESEINHFFTAFPQANYVSFSTVFFDIKDSVIAGSK